MPKNKKHKKHKQQQNTETELKYLLSKKGYEQLCSALKPKKLSETWQKNSYFDTPSKTLRRKKIALRVRTTTKGSQLTVKLPSKKATSIKGLSIRKEFECYIPTQSLRYLSHPKFPSVLDRYEPWKVLCEQVDTKKLTSLKPFASFSTHRQSFRLPEGLVAELDAVELANKEQFFEIEVECKNARKAQQACKALFQAHHIQARPVQRTKLARALASRRK